jgi:Kef-type K+ transport system membrane component KefB
MLGIATLLAGAAIGLGIAKWLRIPTIPVLLVAGVGLSFLGALPEPELLQDTLVLGLTVLVFVAGVELNPRRVGAQKRTALRVGLVQFFVLMGLGGIGALALGFALAESVYLALALTASSTLVVMRMLQQRKQLFEPFGRLVIGVLLLQDLLVIVLISVISHAPAGAVRMLGGLAAVSLMMGLAWVSLRWITPWLVSRLELDEESLLLAILGILFLYLALAEALGLPLVAGAFLAGVSLSSFPVSGVIRGQLSSLSDFFLAIFFTALGGLLMIPSLGGLLQAIALALLVVVATPPLVTFVAERAGLSARSSIEAGLLLAQTSEFSLVVGLQAWAIGHIGQEIFSIIALITVVTMILTPFLATDSTTWRLMRIHPLRRQIEVQRPMEDHVLLLGCGDNGMPLLESPRREEEFAPNADIGRRVIRNIAPRAPRVHVVPPAIIIAARTQRQIRREVERTSDDHLASIVGGEECSEPTRRRPPPRSPPARPEIPRHDQQHHNRHRRADAAARRTAPSHPPVPQDAGRRWRCRASRHWRRTDLRAADPRCRADRRGALLDRESPYGGRTFWSSARLYRPGPGTGAARRSRPPDPRRADKGTASHAPCHDDARRRSRRRTPQGRGRSRALEQRVLPVRPAHGAGRDGHARPCRSRPRRSACDAEPAYRIP